MTEDQTSEAGQQGVDEPSTPRKEEGGTSSAEGSPAYTETSSRTVHGNRRRHMWSIQEDEVLKQLVANYTSRQARPDWDEIARKLQVKRRQAREHYHVLQEQNGKGVKRGQVRCG
ncbi:hypothetical protein KIPB_013198 [Kipferlia bialata]|uniref:Myb-like domain-containing protein n=1 Tax=Kipferlia bialata TaxID=797122 RepID=A0A391NS79_9EUKA|nr:hypothetical protein KIPB_013198 [Kipferlia bialata]|eukprot:g13198.t1